MFDGACRARIIGNVSWAWIIHEHRPFVEPSFVHDGVLDEPAQRLAFDEGYQSPPVNWSLSSERKHAFFKYLTKITRAKNPHAMAWRD